MNDRLNGKISVENVKKIINEQMTPKEIIIDSIHRAVIVDDHIAKYIKCHCFGNRCEGNEKKPLKGCKKYIITAREVKANER